ncbi:hypothetical protein [Streptomyces sp. NPDC048277]|uniref:hypothetical protein n=1 Tax=Streptomyces sp. NPDC048277 TaxID=3155027 RepID=UPI0033D97A9E
MAKSRLTLKAMLCTAVAFLMAAMWSQPASAWTWARSVTVYNGSGLCVRGDAGIDHLRPGVLSGNLAYATVYALAGGCGTGMSGRGAVQAVVYKWNGSAWAVCRSSDWKYGPTGRTGGQFPGPYGPEQVFNWGGAAACGPGYYGTRASAWVWDGSRWRGGGVWSGYEYVSSAGLSSRQGSAPGHAPARSSQPSAVRPPVHAG